MNCYGKIKRVLEKNKGVKVTKSGNMITISKKEEVLTTYDLKFVQYSRDNLRGFLEYWQYRLDGRRKVDLDKEKV